MKRLLLVLLFFTWCNAYGQYHEPHFEHLNVEDGLPESNITAMRQDKLGYIWIGTQNGLVRYDGYNVKVYKLGLGLKGILQDFAISDIYEDKNGELWIASRVNRIFHYNRVADSFEQNKIGLQSDPYFGPELIFDHDGFMWEAPRHLRGLRDVVTYPVSKWNLKTYEEEKFPYQASSMVVTHTGGVWVGTTDGLIFYTHTTGKMSKVIFPLNSKDKYYILNLYEAPSAPGFLWFILVDVKYNSLGLYCLNTRNGQYKKYTADPHISGTIASTDIFTIKEDSHHKLWFGTAAGLSLFDQGNGKFKNYTPPKPKNGLYENSINNIIEQNENTFWLTTFGNKRVGNGLLLFNPSTETFNQYLHEDKKPYSLNVNRVTRALIDHTGLLWVGMAWGGVDRVNNMRTQFDTYLPDIISDKNYLPRLNTTVALSKDGFCWLGTNESLVKWQPNTTRFERVNLPDYLGNKNISVLFADRAGLVYCSTDKVSLFTYNPKTAAVDTFRYPNKWSHTAISRIFQDHNGLIWIGTNDEGLFSFDKNSKTFKAYPYEVNSIGFRYDGNKLDNGQIRSIFEDHQGILWVGTNFGGLNRYDKKLGTFKSYYDRFNGLNCVLQIYEDKSGRFWVGTYLSGLFLFDRETGKSQQITENNGLLINSIQGLQEDKAGNLWISGDRGFTCFNPNNKTFAHYTTSNALPFPLKISVKVSFLKTSNNQFIFSSRNGIVAFYPEQLRINKTPPQVQLETFTHGDPQSTHTETTTEGLYGKQMVEVAHNQNRVSFNYVALHFENPAQNKYAYKLIGYDKNWVQAGIQRSVTYTNLSPGTYTFRVIAANSDGVWNKIGATITLIIHPPWWQTWWALTIWIILFVSAIYGFIAYRSRKLQRQNQMLEEKINLRTSQLSKANVALNEKQEEITAQRDKLAQTITNLKDTQTQLIQSEKMASLGELTAGIAHEIQNPLNFVNNFSEVSVELLAELKEEEEKGNKEEVIAIANDLTQNLDKINHHGKRADAIVKGMLEHSRAGSGAKEPTDINKLADEYLRLSYHGLRAKDKSFNATLITNFDENLPLINVIPQDIGRVFLNLFNNAFYAVNQKAKIADLVYQLEVSVTTLAQNGKVIIKVKDNGIGIPDAIKDKIMQPFFTTKPTGEGTGLGLSLTYDMVVKGHGGSINVESVVGEFTEFIIYLPL